MTDQTIDLSAAEPVLGDAWLPAAAPMEMPRQMLERPARAGRFALIARLFLPRLRA